MDFLYRSSLRGTTLCAATSKSYSASTIIMHVLQCPHDVDVHLVSCFNLDLHLTCSCTT